MTDQKINHFWIWDHQQHNKSPGDCCFNHIVGLPQKETIEKPIFDYQKLLYANLLNPKINNPLHHDFTSILGLKRLLV
jgi:hypothetical protein